MLTVLEILKKTTDFFAAKGIENPRLNAELLVGHALGLKRMQLYLQFERVLAESDLEKIRPLVRRRGLHEPVQYIVGETEWGGMKLKTDRRALIPRPETELLLELVGQLVTAPPTRILDLGTGSGALALGLARKFETARVTAIDSSEEALGLARENAAALAMAERVVFLRSDWFSAVPQDERFDLIVANPPYLSAEETAATAAEVREFEPRSALTAADEGRADLRAIIAAAPSRLAETGVLALETGIAQHAVLQAWCTDAGFGRVQSKQDLTSRDRFLFAWRG
jgi:release factor glutamine methyltransferase